MSARALGVALVLLAASPALGANGNPFLVESYVRQGRHENALKALEGFDVLSPHLMLVKAQCLHALDKPAEAQAALRALLAQYPGAEESARARQLLLQVLEEGRDWEGEIRELRSWLAAASAAERSAWRRLLAFTLVRVGRPEEALVELRDATEPPDLRVLLDVLKETGRWERFLEQERAAAAGDPARRRRLADLLALRGDHAEARRLLEELVAGGAGGKDTLARLLAVLEALRDWKAAVPVLERLLALEPAELAWHQKLGDAWFALGDPDKAVAAWRKPIDLGPREERAYASVASVLVEHKLLPRALEVLREGRATLGQTDLFAAELSAVLADLSRWDEAAHELTPLVPQDRDKAAELLGRLAARGAPAAEACRAALREAIARSPVVGDYYLVLDEVVRRTGDDEAARAAVIDQALKNLGELTDELQELAEQFRGRGRLGAALALRQALEGKLDGLERLRNRLALAEVEQALGRWGAALDHLASVADATAAPGLMREQAQALRGRILHDSLHDLEAARALWKRLAESAPTAAARPGYALQAARASIDLFRFDEARPELDRLKTSAPGALRPEVAWQLGRLLALTGDLDGAEEQLGQVASATEAPSTLDALDLLLVLVEHRAGASSPPEERKATDQAIVRLVRLEALLAARALARYDAEVSQLKPQEVPPSLADEYLLLEAKSARARGSAPAERRALERLAAEQRDSPYRDRALLELAGLLKTRLGDRAAAATLLETHLLDYPDSIRADEARDLLKTVNQPTEGTGTR